MIFIMRIYWFCNNGKQVYYYAFSLSYYALWSSGSMFVFL